eukprot:GEMP01009903.1.p1 GENE.GEMP01009903.1~~GEMP01009903.1.p1  ORF type:complete len:729 (+),score=120.71 GEMP01009903.1:80-2266(+)
MLAKTPLLTKRHYIRAAWRISDAVAGDIQLASYPNTMDAWARHCQSRRWRGRGVFAITALIVLSFFETPCYVPFRPVPEGLDSTLPEIPEKVSLIIQLILFLLLGTQNYFEHFGNPHPSTRNLRMIECSVIFLGTVGALVGLIFGINRYHPLGYGFVYSAPFLRLTLCLCLPTIRRAGAASLSGAYEITSIMIMLLGTVAFTAWIIVMIRVDLGVGATVAGHFDTVTGAMYELFIMWSSSDVPNGFLPFFDKHRFVALLIYPFLGLTIFGFTNLCLAAVYKGYQREMERRLESFYSNRMLGVTKAFYEIVNHDKTDEMSEASFINLVGVLHTLPILNADPTKVSILFRALDVDKSGKLSLEEFFECVDMMQYDFDLFPRQSWLMAFIAKRWPDSTLNDVLHDMQMKILHEKMDKFFNTVLLINGLLVLYESSLDFTGVSIPVAYRVAELVFSLIYIAEILLKLTVLRWRKYWSRSAHRFDFATSIMLLLSAMPAFPREVARYFNILRGLRLLRLVRRVKRLGFLYTCMARMLSASKDVLLFVLCCFYFYASIGITMFGGVLRLDDPRLQGSDYLKNGLHLLNFNDYPMTFGVLFSWMIADYIREVPDALAAVSSSHGYPVWFPHIYFCTWFVVSVILCFNIFIAFCIDIFVSIQEEEESRRMQKALRVRKAGSHHERFDDLYHDLWQDGWILNAEMSSAVTKSHLYANMFEQVRKSIVRQYAMADDGA